MSNLTNSQRTRIYQQIGQILRRAREDNELELDEADARLGLKAGVISKCENGSAIKLGAQTLGGLINMLAGYNRLPVFDTVAFTPQKAYTFTVEELVNLLKNGQKSE